MGWRLNLEPLLLFQLTSQLEPLMDLCRILQQSLSIREH